MNQTKLTPFKHQTKTQALSTYLTEMANQLGPDARMPTMQQLCDSLGVSVVTLNRALSELEAQNIIYRKHGVGIFVSPRLNQRTVGLVYDRDIFQPGSSPFCGLLVEGARSRAATGSESFSFYLAMTSKEGLPVHDDLVEDLRARRLSGLLFIGEQNPQAAEWLQRQGVPLVALAHTAVAPYRVHIDWPEAVKLAVAALADQGCKQIGLWIPLGSGLGRTGDATSFPELDAYQQTLKKRGLTYNAKLVWENNHLNDRYDAGGEGTNQEQGFRAAFEVFDPNSNPANRPDGLVILDDMMARGALVALRQLEIQPGKAVRIAAHANQGSGVLAGYESDLIRIEIDPAEIIQAMFDMLETLMDGGTPTKRTVAVKPRIVR